MSTRPRPTDASGGSDNRKTLKQLVRDMFGFDAWDFETDDWHIHTHAILNAVTRVRFIRGENAHIPGRASLRISFYGPGDQPLLQCFVAKLYDQDGQPTAARFARWEELRTTYGGGRDEVLVENGALVSATVAM